MLCLVSFFLYCRSQFCWCGRDFHGIPVSVWPSGTRGPICIEKHCVSEICMIWGRNFALQRASQANSLSFLVEPMRAVCIRQEITINFFCSCAARFFEPNLNLVEVIRLKQIPFQPHWSISAVQFGRIRVRTEQSDGIVWLCSLCGCSQCSKKYRFSVVKCCRNMGGCLVVYRGQGDDIPRNIPHFRLGYVYCRRYTRKE